MLSELRFPNTVTVLSQDTEHRYHWSDVYEEADHMGGWLQQQGVGPNDTIITFGRTSIDHVVTILAAWLAGAAISVSSVPIRPRKSIALRERFAMAHSALRPKVIVGDEDLLPLLELEAESDRVLSFPQLRESVLDRGPRLAADYAHCKDSPAVMQLTSGTTGAPKIAEVPYRCLTANLKAIRTRLEISQADTVVSWLPLSHDMGLVGFLATPMITGANLVIADPSVFAASPPRWMEWCSGHRGTITGGPSFAYDIAAKTFAGYESGDLSSLRLAMNGSEPVDVGACRGFALEASKRGMSVDAMFPVYGLAEATLAVTFPRLNSGLQTDVVDRAALAKRRALLLSDVVDPSRCRELPKLGVPLDGLDVRVLTAGGHCARPLEVGSIQVRGDSVIAGYHGSPPFATEWFDTGDLGYMSDAQLVVCGRQKDIIIIAGRNIYPDEIESQLGQLPGVWRGHVAVFETNGRSRQSVGVLAEAEDVQDKGLVDVLKQVAEDWSGARVSCVKLVEPGSLPKTPSGKLARSACKEQVGN
ncbi:MAG: AMP-binding protein [Acidimicrobiales bacterium]